MTTVNEQLTVPSNVPAGTYQLYLYLPDAYASIASNPKYAVRFANSNVWESSTGMNKLTAAVTITGGGSPVDPPQPQGDAIRLPATLNKANVTAYSADMTWYNSDYFDFGPEDDPNLDRWAEWDVELRYQGEYFVSEVMASVNNDGNIVGHSWQIQLLDNGTPVSTYTTPGKWAEGEIAYEDKWNLTNVPAGIYTLRVQNAMQWAQPKLQSLTLQYDGIIPADNQDITITNNQSSVTIMYDILGRPVNESYHGIVIVNGQKVLR